MTHPAPAPSAPTRDQVGAARRATYTVFAGSGFAIATWASRIPQVRTHFALDPARLGLVLFAIAAGSVVSLPLSGPVVARIGSRRAVAAMATVLAVALGIVAVGYRVGLLPVVIGLFVLGLGNGFWDVAMNVQAAVVERHTGRSIMSKFHAGFSIGTVAGALVGVAMVALHVGVSVHLGAVAVLVLVAVPWSTRGFVADHDGHPDAEPATAGTTTTAAGTPIAATDTVDPSAGLGSAPVRRSALAPWRERRTVLVGLVVLAFTFGEGAGGDWISVSVIDHHHAAAAVGTLGYAVFLTAMTATRWFGSGLLDRYGRVRVLRSLAVLAAAGVVVFVFSPNTPLAFVGAVMWGLGASLGFPVGMSAGADEPRFAAGRVSVIASIGYCAFLGGPPLIGLLGNHVSIDHALLAVAVLLVVAVLLAGATRPLVPGAPAVREASVPEELVG